MKFISFFALSLFLSVSILLVGCGSSSKTEEPTPAAEPAPVPEQTTEPAPEPVPEPAQTTAPAPPHTAGQKLIDLNKAREAGAITDEEYDAAKIRILDQQ